MSIRSVPTVSSTGYSFSYLDAMPDLPVGVMNTPMGVEAKHYRPANVIVVHSGVVEIQAAGLATDYDGTQVHLTGPLVHDEFDGRFSVPLWHIVRERGALKGEIEDWKEAKNRKEAKDPLPLSQWKETWREKFGRVGGANETAVRENIVDIANKIFQLSPPLTYDEYHTAVAEYLDRHSSHYFHRTGGKQQISVDPSALGLIEQANQLGIVTAMVTASSEEFIAATAKRQGSDLAKVVNAFKPGMIFTDADKRGKDFRYYPNSMNEACRAMRLPPGSIVYMGDNLPDPLSSQITGDNWGIPLIGVTILRFDPSESEDRIAKFLDMYAKLKDSPYGETREMTVVIVRDFNQVKLSRGVGPATVVVPDGTERKPEGGRSQMKLSGGF